MTSHIQEDRIKSNSDFSWKQFRQEGNGMIYLGAEKKDTVNQESYIHQNYLSKMKAKERHLTPRKTWRICC